jgi:hypothetical protein
LVSEKRLFRKNCKASVVEQVGFDLLGAELAQDVESSLLFTLKMGAVFPCKSTPISILRQSIATAIRDINADYRGQLFQRFLKDGPYEKEGKIPTQLRDKRLSDDDTTTVIAFIYSYMVNCFKGAITELLAAAPCMWILKKMQKEHYLPPSAKLYAGDSVLVARRKGRGFAKGADLHFLCEHCSSRGNRSLVVNGVVEVKSYYCSPKRLKKQLDKHLARAQRGLRIREIEYTTNHITIGNDRRGKAIRVGILPAHWLLPRTFRFEPKGDNRFLSVDEGHPHETENKITRVAEDYWQVVLRWSKEAISEAAYELTFWYMEKVGEVIYASGVPKEWSEMSPAEAGRNAAKMMLYYAIRRCRTKREEQRAIALYNSYCFGYALGMNYRNSKGHREMLWPVDLDEILVNGCTKHGNRFH